LSRYVIVNFVELSCQCLRCRFVKPTLQNVTCGGVLIHCQSVKTASDCE